MQGDWPYLRVPQHEDTKKNAAWTVVESPEDGWKNWSCFFHTLRSTITCLMDLEKRGNCPKTIGSQGGWHVMIFLNLSKFATPWIRTSCWITTLWNFMRILFLFLSGSFHVVLNTWIFLKVIFPHKKKNSMFDVLLLKHGQFSKIFWKVPTFWPSRQEPPWVTARCRRKTRTNVTRPTDF